ncbi:hypothetical protein DOT_3256 [Desulfosporosinus sp. OT]|nr:hypothetical protein DOT_3256 [Desulfosporosinus sp. OT]
MPPLSSISSKCSKGNPRYPQQILQTPLSLSDAHFTRRLWRIIV